tara:strand:+ start:19775 stop:20395 length:621 start_codon:yes stop_codon:yes gene_type:complete
MDKSLPNEAINIFVFNKSKKPTIIFIHGLFSSSGYWLPFLTYFSEFKILILDIDYLKIFNISPQKINFYSFFESILKDEKHYTLISHSMGTILAQFFPEKKIKISYEICPIINSVEKNKNKFIEQISFLSNFSNEEISSLLNKATIFLSSYFLGENKLLSKKKYVPKIDSFFDNSFNDVEYFEGNHFDILNSILMINKDLIHEKLK